VTGEAQRILKPMAGWLAAAFLCGLASPAIAQPYPAKPIRIITANSVGGTSDIFVRALGDELQKRIDPAAG
jgi:tripartite-type tricarboxylate transporter receptor subunit TctC